MVISGRTVYASKHLSAHLTWDSHKMSTKTGHFPQKSHNQVLEVLNYGFSNEI